MIAIYVIVLFSILVVHYYVGRKIFGWLRLIFPKIRGYLFWSIFLVIIACFILGNLLPTLWFSSTLANIVNYWIAIFFYTLLFLILFELLQLLAKLRLLPVGIVRSKKSKKTAGTLVFVCIIGLISYGSYHAKQIKTIQYDIQIQKPANRLQELKILMISDLHLGYIYGADDVRKMVEKINKLNPDLVCLAGDIFDGNINSVDNPDKAAAAFKKLKSKYGVYSCLGNHDAGETYDQMITFFKNADIELLEDQSLLVDDQLVIAGMKDSQPIGSQGKPRTQIDHVLAQVDKSKPIILLDHNPANIDEAEQSGVDLMLSGHTHRGQLFPFNFVTEMSYKVDWGYLKTGASQIIVSSGVGTWGPPMRIGSSSEIVEINIHFQ